MGLTREEKKRKTKRAIVKAAVKLFGEKGFHKTSIKELAKEAGIGKGTIYTYFQTKTEIFHAFCEEELEYIHDEITEKTDSEAPFLDQLMTIYFSEFRYVTENKEFGRLYMQEIIFPQEKEFLKAEELDDRWLNLVFSIYKRAQERNELRKDLDLLYIAGHFYGLYIMTISAWYSGRIPTDEVETGMRKLFQQALDGLAPL